MYSLPTFLDAVYIVGKIFQSHGSYGIHIHTYIHKYIYTHIYLNTKYLTLSGDVVFKKVTKKVFFRS